MFRDHKSYRTLTEAEKGNRTKGRPYKSRQSLNYGKKKYNCDICSKKWMSEIDAEYHREFEHGTWLKEAARDEKNNVCGICFRTQRTRSHLITHIKTEHYHSPPYAKRVEREIYFCDVCQHMFFNKLVLTWHIVHAHFKHVRVKLDCVLCLRSPSSRTVWWHSLAHSFSSFTTCPFCFENFKEKEEMLSHVSKHKYLLRCDTCLYETKIRESYDKHLQAHSERSINDISYERFFVMNKEPEYVVEAWLKGIPVPLGLAICVLCREICTDEDSKHRHITIEHGIVIQNKKTHMCACGEDFFNGLLLKHHVWKSKGIHRVLSEDEMKNLDKSSSMDSIQDIANQEMKDPDASSSTSDLEEIVVIIPEEELEEDKELFEAYVIQED